MEMIGSLSLIDFQDHHYEGSINYWWIVHVQYFWHTWWGPLNEIQLAI